MKKTLTSKRLWLSVPSPVIPIRQLAGLALLLLAFHPLAGFSQTTARLNINLENATLEQFVNAVQEQSNFSFFYKDTEINPNEKISVAATGQTVENVLSAAFRGKNIVWQIEGNQIVLSKRPPAPSPSPAGGGINVKGIVTTANGEPLIGVSVTIVGRTTGGVITDQDGWYTLDAPGTNSTIEFRYLGYETATAVVGNRTLINMTMTQNAAEIENVVVVGYGAQKRVTVTGSVSSVNVADIRTPMPNLSNSLQGKVSGIISVQSSGEPGYDNSTFTIRGIGSFTGNTSPLIVVDGVQRADFNSINSGTFNNIDPEDVASISLLKDASATAVYGAKGANGVLIITTKRGQTGRPRVSMKVETGLTAFTKTPEMLDAVNYKRLYNEARRNSGQSETYSYANIRITENGLDPYLYPNVNWMEEVYRDFSSVTQAHVNVTGGSELVRYYVSGSFYDQEGQYKVTKQNGFNPNLSYQRYDFRSNVDANISKTTLLQLNISAMLVNARYPNVSSGELWYQTLAMTPAAFPVKYPDGRWAGPVLNGGVNPLNEVQNRGYSHEFNPTVQSVFTLNQKLDFITEGLSAYGRFSFDSYGRFSNYRWGNVDLWNVTRRDGDGNLIYGNPVVYATEYLSFSNGSDGEYSLYLEGNVAYDRTFGDHSVSGMVLYNMRNRRVSTAGDAISSIPFRNQAVAGRISYGYKDKYLLEVNSSYTGSENFDAGYRFGFFPAISGGWVVSNEKFFAPLTKTIDLLKLRASYGLVGNDNIGGGYDEYGNVRRFGYLTQISGGGSYGFGANGSWVSGIRESVVGTAGLTWEKSYKTNLGLEVGLLGKVNLTVDYFFENRKDILIARAALPSFSGLTGSTIYANMGEMANKGFDFNVEYDDRFGKVGLRAYANVSYSRNMIVFQDEPVRKYDYMRSTGKKYGSFYGYTAEGLFATQDEADNSPSQFGSRPMAGDIKYRDLNGDNVIDSYDASYLDRSWFPDWSYGVGFTVNYANFDLSLFFQGVSGVGIMANGSDIRGNGKGVDGVGVIPFSGMGQYPNNVITKALDRWTEENPDPDAWYPRLRYNDSTVSNNYLNSTHWLKDGSYLRLKQAALGYTLANEKLETAGIENLYFYLSGSNLFTFSKFKLWDPELGSNAAKYPINRMLTLGVRIQF